MFAEPLQTFIQSINVFVLILGRMMGMFLIAPMFGRNSIPPMVKIALAILFSYILLPTQFYQLEINNNTIEIAFLLIREITIGLGLGFVAQTFFSIFLTAGSIMDLSIGLSMSRALDPQSGTQVTITSKLLDTFAYLVFFAINGHHFLVKALINSYIILPIGSTVVINENFLAFFIRLLTYLFTSAITLGIPIMISIFMANLLLAFMNKIMPQMNVFIVGMPMKIFLGLSMIIISVPFMTELIKTVFYKMLEYMYFFTNLIKG